MQITFIPDTQKVTLKDRFVAAYYAFRMDLKPDMKAFVQRHEELHAKHEELVRQSETRWDNALSNLEGYDRAIADSVAGATENWRVLFEQLLTSIEKLDELEQIAIMRHIFSTNRQVVRTASFRNWMARHAEALIDSVPE